MIGNRATRYVQFLAMGFDRSLMAYPRALTESLTSKDIIASIQMSVHIPV